MRVLLSLLFALWSNMALAQSYPDYHEIYVNDFAALIGQDDEEIIRENLKELRAETGIEFTVLTIQRMSVFGHDGPIEPFATGLFNYWGIGNAVRNDGVLMLVSLEDRRMRLEVGSGYGDSKNDAMAGIIDTVIIPYFRDDDYSTGIRRGVEEVIYDLTGSYPGEFNMSASERFWKRFSNGAVGFIQRIGDWIFVGYAFIAGLLFRLYRRYKRNKPRICPRDGMKMRRVAEDKDDPFLKDGERVEERLKSVDYDVWVCDSCDHITIESYRSWFTAYTLCRSCQYRTLEGDTTILEHATTSSTGLARIDYTCHNCGDTYSTHKTIPKKSKSSSSSGSSFGGGSSSGGGARGSW